MSASKDQTPFGAGTTFGPTSGDSQQGTSAGTVGSNSGSGHGQNPRDTGDDSNATESSSKIGPQDEDLEGEQMRATGEGEVMDAQHDKKNAGWGEQESLTSDLDRKKEEQRGARDQMKSERNGGADVDGGAGGRVDNEGLSSV